MLAEEFHSLHGQRPWGPAVHGPQAAWPGGLSPRRALVRPAPLTWDKVEGMGEVVYKRSPWQSGRGAQPPQSLWEAKRTGWERRLSATGRWGAADRTSGRPRLGTSTPATTASQPDLGQLRSRGQTTRTAAARGHASPKHRAAPEPAHRGESLAQGSQTPLRGASFPMCAMGLYIPVPQGLQA